MIVNYTHINEKTYGIAALLLFLFVMSTPALLAQTKECPVLQTARVSSYDLENGLLISTVEDVFEDNYGRLWVNPGGLQTMHKSFDFYQFDGRQSINPAIPAEYKKEPYKQVRLLSMMPQEDFILGKVTNSPYFFLFNTNLSSFETIKLDENETALDAVVDEDGHIYLYSCSESFNFIYELINDKLQRIAVFENKIPDRVKGFTDFNFIKQGNSLWLFDEPSSSEERTRLNFNLIKINLFTGGISKFKVSELLKKYFKPGTYGANRRLYPGKPEEILLCLEGSHKIFSFDITSMQIRPYNELASYLKDDIIAYNDMRLYKDKSGNTIFGFQTRRSTGLIWEYLLVDRQKNFFNYNEIVDAAVKASRFKRPFSIFISGRNFKKQAIISLHGGLSVIDVKPIDVNEVFFKNNQIRSINEIRPNEFLVFLDDNKIFSLDLATQQTQLLPANFFRLSASDRTFYSLIRAKELGNLFFAAGDKLVNYDFNRDSCVVYDVGVNFFKFDFIEDEKIALVSSSGQLYTYDLTGRSLNLFSINGLPFSISAQVNDCYFARDGYLWIASLNGLYKVQPIQKQVTRLDEATGLSDHRVMSILETKGGKLWLGTFTGGINIFDPANSTIKVIKEANGLSNNTVVGILEDDNGYFWASTFDGLTLLDSTGRVLSVMYEEDGLSSREFNRYSSFKGSNGQLFLGTINGLNVLNPQKLYSFFRKEMPLKIYPVGIRYFNDKVNQEKNIIHEYAPDSYIQISPLNRYIKVNFALSSYQSIENANFLYRIDNNEWMGIGSDTELVLNNLPFGRHTIQIKGLNYRGRVTARPLVIPIRVKRFFYQTNWFYLLVLTVLGCVIWGIIRMNSLEQERLRKSVNRATQKLKEDNKLIEEQSKRLKLTDQIRTRFYNNFINGLKTPLSVILSAATKIKQAPERWIVEGPELILENTDYLLKMVNQIVDLGKLQAGHLSINLSHGDLQLFIKNKIDYFEPQARLKDIELHYLPDMQELPTIFDPDKMESILSCLLSNAIKFTPDHGNVYIQLYTNFNSQAQKEEIILSVKDTGVGIPAEEIPRIFDYFYRVENNNGAGDGGTGIGLTLVKELTELLGGQVEVDSSVGEGSTFIIKLPIIEDSSVGEKTILSTEAAAIAATDKATKELKAGLVSSTDAALILLIDDDPFFIRFLTKILGAKYRISTAMNGQDGLERAKSESPDLIICDLFMPSKDGFEVCQTMKEDPATRNIPIIMVTGDTSIEAKVKAIKLGVKSFISKPFDVQELETLVEALLESKTYERENNFKVQSSSSDEAFLKLTRSIIEKNLEDFTFGTNELGQAVGLSRSQLYKRIKSLTGHSTSIYIRLIRLERARELLLNTKLNVSEVAYQTGFKDPKYFSRLFIEKYGVPPSEIKK